DLQVAELEHAVAPLDHGDLGAEGGEHRRVLDADHAGPDHDHRLRDAVEVDDPVRVDDRLVVEVDALRPGRTGAGGDDDLLGGDDLVPPAGLVLERDRVRVGEPGRTVQQPDPVAGQLAADDVHLPADDVLRAGGEIGDRDVLFEAVTLPVHFPLVETGQVE